MELKKIFEFLIVNQNGSTSSFLAEEISFSKHGIRLAIDSDKNPILLIPENDLKNKSFNTPNYKFNFLEINFDQLCKVNSLSIKDMVEEINFTTIKLIGGNLRMVDYFLRAIEGLIIQLNKNFTANNLKTEIDLLVDLFSKRKSVGLNIIIGLWGELYFISQAPDIEKALKAWHLSEDDLFDFSYEKGNYCEIKTTIEKTRTHNFSNKQIENYKELSVELVSIQTEINNTGKSLNDLWNSIDEKIIYNDELKRKLFRLISNTLKNNFHALHEYRFDSSLAASSLKTFNSKQLPTIKEKLHHSIRKMTLTIDLDLII